MTLNFTWQQVSVLEFWGMWNSLLLLSDPLWPRVVVLLYLTYRWDPHLGQIDMHKKKKKKKKNHSYSTGPCAKKKKLKKKKKVLNKYKKCEYEYTMNMMPYPLSIN